MARPVANWKDKAAYPRGAAISFRRWAWEFLRRNPSYQEDWEAYCSVCRAILPNCEPGTAFSDDPDEGARLAGVLYNDDRFLVCDPEKLDGESEEEWVRRVGRGTYTPLNCWYGRRYGLDNTFPNPYAKNWFPGGSPWFVTSPRAVFVTEHWPEFKARRPGIWRNRHVALAIDLALPIEPQLREAAERLAEAQRDLIDAGEIEPWPEKRNRNTEWTDLLRILDAKAAGASLAEMAAEFFPYQANEYPDYAGSKKAQKRLKSAESMASEGYRFLPMLLK